MSRKVFFLNELKQSVESPLPAVYKVWWSRHWKSRKGLLQNCMINTTRQRQRDDLEAQRRQIQVGVKPSPGEKQGMQQRWGPLCRKPAAEDGATGSPRAKRPGRDRVQMPFLKFQVLLFLLIITKWWFTVYWIIFLQKSFRNMRSLICTRNCYKHFICVT